MVGSSYPGGGEASKGLAVRQLKRYVSWVQTVQQLNMSWEIERFEPRGKNVLTAYSAYRERIGNDKFTAAICSDVYREAN